jgi:DNA-binding transcriptional LysR family regulator
LAVNELDAGLADLGALAGAAGGRVSIGAMPLARARLLPKAIARFHTAFPTITVSVIEGAHAELIELLRDGRLDFLVGALRTPSPGPDIAQSALIVDRPAVYARAGHPLASKARPTARDFSAYPWIIPHAGAPLRDRWCALFGDAGLNLPPAPIECGSVMVIRGLLEDTDMLTLMSPDQVALEVRSGVLRRLGAPIASARREIGLSTRADWRPTQAQAACLDMLRAVAAESTLPKNQ